MNWDALGAMAEFIGAIAVIATLIYLSIQIRQNTQITKAQISNDYYLADMKLELAMMGQNPAKPWTKSVYAPNEITKEDAVILDRYFNYGLVQIQRLQRMHELGIADDDWKNRISYLSWHLGNEVGRRWWAFSKAAFPYDFVQSVDEVLANGEFRYNQEVLDAMVSEPRAELS